MRVIAATHQDLEARVRSGQFREDLFHRLNVIRLKLPPLRERHEDIALLARHFLQKSARELKVEPKQISPQAMETLVRLPFPGNVRQLENLCHWMTVMAPSQVVQVDDLPADLRHSDAGSTTDVEEPVQAIKINSIKTGPEQDSSVPAETLRWQDLLREEVARTLGNAEFVDNPEGRMNQWSREFETAVLGIALKHTRGRRMEAAQLLGIGRNTMTRKIAELRLEDDR